MPARTRVAALLLFGSGFCALIYQTTWLREFRLIFGASTAASAAVLGVFMAGLGFGGIVLGRRSENAARPLVFYGRLELLIAFSAALSPLLILAARHIYVALGGTETMGMPLGTIVRLVLAVIILGVPTFAMGGTLPAVARAVITSDDVSRRSLGLLYGVNTLGAVTGAIAATFYFFENFGNHLTLWWAAGLNVIIALIALHFARSMPEVQREARFDSHTDTTAPSVNSIFVFAAAGVVGFAFLLMEMVWYRMLAPLLGGSTFAFGLILSVALLGIGFGAVVYAFFDLKKSSSMQFFAITCAAEAFFIGLPYALGDRIATTTMLLRPLGTLGFYGHVMAWAAVCSIVVLPAAFVSGLQFPLLISLLGKGSTRVGSQTGAAYAWNTIGALIGSLAGGFGFMPMFSAPGVWKLVVLLLASVAILAAAVDVKDWRHWFRALCPLSIAATAIVLLTANGPTAFWRHSQIGVGGMRQYHASRNEMRDLVNGIRRQVFWQMDGIESSVALADADSLAFIVNGKSDGNAKTDAGTQVMCGLVGAALHPNPQNAMVIGLGTGSTAGWLAAVPTMDRVDVVELERGILKVAELCAPVNHDALANPKVHVIIGDGRETLLTTRRKYDLVVSEPSNPYRAGVAGLFTREFYQSIEHRLESGGIFVQWMQTYDVDDRTIETFYRTLGSVFGNIESWQTQEGDLLLVASREPLTYDIPTLRKRLAAEPFKTALRAAWRATSLEDFISHYVANAAVARKMANLQPWPLNTDDQTVIEFAFARSLGATNSFQMLNLRAAARSAGCDRPPIAKHEIDWARVREGQLSSYVTVSGSEQVQVASTADERNRADAFVNYARGDLAGALRSWRAQPAAPQTLNQLALVAESLAAAGDSSAEGYIDKIAAVAPLDAEAIRVELFLQQGKLFAATKALQHFLLALHTDPWPDQDLIRRSFGRAEIIARADPSRNAAREFYHVLSKPLSVSNCEADRRSRVLTLGLYLDGNKPGENTVRAVMAFEPYIMWDRRFLEIRKAGYIAVHDDARAQVATRDLDDFIGHQAFTSDVSALARVFKSSSANDKSGYAIEAK
ncbi:MAG: spermidine synthase [Verrucomicrobiota bacterium]|jgi:spermidine synthase